MCLWAQHSKKLFVCMLFVTRACYINSHFVDSIVECQLYFPVVSVYHALCNRYFSSGARSKSFWIRILFHKYDTLTECYGVPSNSYRISYEREYILWFIGPSKVLKLLKIAQAVGLLERIWSTLNVRHLNLRSNLQLSLSLFKWFVQLIWLIIIPSQFNILTCCYFTYRHQNH